MQASERKRSRDYKEATATASAEALIARQGQQGETNSNAAPRLQATKDHTLARTTRHKLRYHAKNQGPAGTFSLESTNPTYLNQVRTHSFLFIKRTPLYHISSTVGRSIATR